MNQNIFILSGHKSVYVPTWDIIIFFINIFRFWCFTIQHYKKKFGAEFS